MENKKTLSYVLVAIVLVLVLVALWYMFGMNKTVANPATVNQITNTAASQEEIQAAKEAKQDEAEQERVEDIQSEREKLLAEQARIEAETQADTSSTSTEPGTVDPQAAERQQEIELELLELKNQEEYPPLPDPGV